MSGTQIRYINSIPLMLNAHYYIGGKRDQLRPYLGVNVGTYYITQRLDMGVYTLQNDNWHFGIAPEFGFLAEVSRGTYLTASGRYNYAFDSGDSWCRRRARTSIRTGASTSASCGATPGSDPARPTKTNKARTMSSGPCRFILATEFLYFTSIIFLTELNCPASIR